MCSTFNRLTPDERHWIADMGGWTAPVPIHPRMVTVYGPRAYAGLQRRMFGGVVSHSNRTEAARWTTWVVPLAASSLRRPENLERKDSHV